IREEHRHHPDRGAREDEARDGEVVLHHALLHEVAHHDQHDQVEGLEGGELATPDDPGEQEDEEKRRAGAENDVHYGKIVTERLIRSSGVVPSSSSTFCGRRPTFVGFTWSWRK